MVILSKEELDLVGNAFECAKSHSDFFEDEKSSALNEIFNKLLSICSDSICGFCGEPGADKYPHPVRWPGEELAGTELVHPECEDEECKRAHSMLNDKQREEFLRKL